MTNFSKLIHPHVWASVSKCQSKNITKCYIYVFERDPNNISYVSFPYLKICETVSKHSPYGEITGYRLFPKPPYFETDNTGNYDHSTIEVSKDEPDYTRLNNTISLSNHPENSNRVNEVLQSIMMSLAGFRNTLVRTVNFKSDANTTKAVAFVVIINKRFCISSLGSIKKMVKNEYFHCRFY